MKKSLMLRISLIALIIFMATIVYCFRQSESLDSIDKLWQIESLYFKIEEQLYISDEKQISFRFGIKEEFPQLKVTSFPGKIKMQSLCNSTYIRSDYFNAKISVVDCSEDLFSGVYDIEMPLISRFQTNPSVVLESDKWIIKLSDVYAFDENNFSINIDRDPSVVLENVNNKNYRYLRGIK